ncbi:MAG: hypothetical protein IJA60_07960 [Clostridia bacterium]|nr:hypothetical protein [Clostridia bacterium]
MCFAIGLVFCAALICVELLHRREREKIIRTFCGLSQRESHPRHISPHRKAVDEKRRINK